MQRAVDQTTKSLRALLLFHFDSPLSKLRLASNEKSTNLSISALIRVRTTGFEPARLLAPPPQDGMSTNFTTCASVFPAVRPTNIAVLLKDFSSFNGILANLGIFTETYVFHEC